MCTWKAARDIHSGLNLQPGCQTLNGDMALAYARSRYYEEWDGTDWQIDPRADLGRIERQQFFIRAAVNGMLSDIESSPFGSGDTIEAVTDSVRIDPGSTRSRPRRRCARRPQTGLHTYSLPGRTTTPSATPPCCGSAMAPTRCSPTSAARARRRQQFETVDRPGARADARPDVRRRT